MPQKIGRNAPCPCGSGKKYKKCCLAEDEASKQGSAAEHPTAGGGVARALSWLSERYHVESIEALEQDYYGALSEDARQAIEELPDDLYEMQRINAFEWLIAEGTLAPDNEDERAEPIRFVDLVLWENGPLLDVEDREYLSRLGEVPLKLCGSARGKSSSSPGSPVVFCGSLHGRVDWVCGSTREVDFSGFVAEPP